MLLHAACLIFVAAAASAATAQVRPHTLRLRSPTLLPDREHVKTPAHTERIPILPHSNSWLPPDHPFFPPQKSYIAASPRHRAYGADSAPVPYPYSPHTAYFASSLHTAKKTTYPNPTHDSLSDRDFDKTSDPLILPAHLPNEDSGESESRSSEHYDSEECKDDSFHHPSERTNEDSGESETRSSEHSEEHKDDSFHHPSERINEDSGESESRSSEHSEEHKDDSFLHPSERINDDSGESESRSSPWLDSEDYNDDSFLHPSERINEDSGERESRSSPWLLPHRNEYPDGSSESLAPSHETYEQINYKGPETISYISHHKHK